eukprot:3938110-Rhodomonas_salina.1
MSGANEEPLLSTSYEGKLGGSVALSTGTATVLQPYSGSWSHVTVPGRGLCVAMVDVYCALTSRSRHKGQGWAYDMQKGLDGDAFKALIGEKVSAVPTYTGATWVLTYDECFELLGWLPRKRVRGFHRFIDQQFARICDGDKSLYNEIESNKDIGGWVAFKVALNENKKRAAAEMETLAPGYVYAAYSEGNGVKIGYTCKSAVMDRVRALNTAVRNAYQLVDFIRCGDPSTLEKFILHRLDDHRASTHNKELFNVDVGDVHELFHQVRNGLSFIEGSSYESGAVNCDKLDAFLRLYHT